MSAVVYNVTCFDEVCEVFWLDADGDRHETPVSLSEQDKDVVMNRLAEGHLYHGQTFTVLSGNVDTPLVYDRMVQLDFRFGETEFQILNLKPTDIDPGFLDTHATALFIVTDNHGHMGYLQSILDHQRLSMVGRSSQAFALKLRHPLALDVAEGIESLFAADEYVKKISFIAIR